VCLTLATPQQGSCSTGPGSSQQQQQQQQQHGQPPLMLLLSWRRLQLLAAPAVHLLGHLVTTTGEGGWEGE
jgi:hypothetical protein